MGLETRAVLDRVAKQIVTIFSKTCSDSIEPDFLTPK